MLVFYVFAEINQIETFICIHSLQMVICFLKFMLVFEFYGNNVGNRDITSWGFADMARSTIDFAISFTPLSDGMLLVKIWKII